MNLARVGARVTGIDVSEGMMSMARQRVGRSGIADRVGLVVADARCMPFGDRRFDAAFASFTLELFGGGEMRRVLSEVRRVLRRRGRLAVVSLFDDPGGGLPLGIYRWLHRHFPHFVDCRPIRTIARLEAAGFRIDRRERLAIWGLPVIAALAHRL